MLIGSRTRRGDAKARGVRFSGEGHESGEEQAAARISKRVFEGGGWEGDEVKGQQDASNSSRRGREGGRRGRHCRE